MSMQLFEDLRFFIGSFFMIVGLLLVAQSFLNPTLVEGYNLNLITGTCFIVFAIAALAMAITAVRKNKLISPIK